MLLLFLITAAVLFGGLFLLWSLPDDDAAEKDALNGAAPRPAAPQSLEGVLVAQLGRGEIDRRQYRTAMALLAARENQRHPMTVPPEPGTAAA